MYRLFLILLLFCACDREIKSDKSVDDSLGYFLSRAQDKSKDKRFRLFHSEKALKLLEGKTNDSIRRQSAFLVAKNFYDLGAESDLLSTSFSLIDLSNRVSDSLTLAQTYNLLGNQYINKGKNDSAYFYIIKAEKLFRRLDDSIGAGKNFIDKAFVQLYENDFSGCELSSIEGLAFLKNFSLKQSEYDAYNLIGISSNELRNFENAITYHQKALTLANENQLNPNFHFPANSRNNLGVVYQNLNQHKTAVKYFEAALKENNLLKDYPSLYAMVTDNLAYSKFKLGETANLPALFYKALEIREKNNLASGVIANKIHLSEFFANRRDSINAQKYAREALDLAKSTKISGDLLGSLKQLSIVEHKNASKYSKEYIRISDSIQQSERNMKNKFARIAYETEEISIQKNKLAEQNRTLFYFFLGTFAIGILLFVIRSQRSKNRELLLKQAQQKANEDIYSLMISQQDRIEESRIKEKKRIAQELHDGVLGRLFGTRLNLDSLNRNSEPDAIEKRNEYLIALKDIEQDIREISHDLNREKFVIINNFVAIINNLIEDQRNLFTRNVICTIDEEIKWELVNNTIKINIYRILQESLQNINKYSRSENVVVGIKNLHGKIHLIISDDGVGFNVNQKSKGIGIQNIVSRAQQIDGTVDIKSKKGKGTVIQVTIPISH